MHFGVQGKPAVALTEPLDYATFIRDCFLHMTVSDAMLGISSLGYAAEAEESPHTSGYTTSLSSHRRRTCFLPAHHISASGPRGLHLLVGHSVRQVWTGVHRVHGG